MNKFTAIGRVITDPEFRQVGGVDVCDFKLSVRTRGKNDQGYPNSIIVKCTVWRKLAEMAKNFGLYKGQTVGVSGMLDLDVYTDKNGIPRTKTGDADDGAFVNAPTAGMMAVTDPTCPF